MMATSTFRTRAADTARNPARRQHQLSHLHRRLQQHRHRPLAPEDVHPRRGHAQRERLAREAVGTFRFISTSVVNNQYVPRLAFAAADALQL